MNKYPVKLIAGDTTDAPDTGAVMFRAIEYGFGVNGAYLPVYEHQKWDHVPPTKPEFVIAGDTTDAPDTGAVMFRGMKVDEGHGGNSVRMPSATGNDCHGNEYSDQRTLRGVA